MARRVRQGTLNCAVRLSRLGLRHASPGSVPNAAPPAPPVSTLTVATRRSALALAQCRAFVERLSALDRSVQMRELQIVTSGDRIQDWPLADIGGKGLFVKEIEDALLD